MDTRNSSGVERRRVPLDGNHPRTHPSHSGQTAIKAYPPSDKRDARLKDGDVLGRMAYAQADWPTIDAGVDGPERRIGGAP